jgi:phosphopantothenoylcysteine decarboxylase/phosphopantothenate--cysteine ligase
VKPTVLVTAGPTREYVDPVRFLSNPSTGKMGYALARAARDRGARVILVSGPVTLRAPKGVRVVRVESAAEMCREVMRLYRDADVVIMAAAVADYRPEKRSRSKMKKGSRALTVRMVKTEDILYILGKRKGKRILIGFAAETGSLLREARRKLEEKKLDMIVANDVSRRAAGFASDYNRGVLIDRDGNVQRLPLMSKEKLARLVIGRCFRLTAS